MIVKVQLSVPNRDRVLIYNKARDYSYEDGISKSDPLQKLMGKEYKAFFHAVAVKNKEKSTGKERFHLTVPNSLDKMFVNKPKAGKTTYTIQIGARAEYQNW